MRSPHHRRLSAHQARNRGYLSMTALPVIRLYGPPYGRQMASALKLAFRIERTVRVYIEINVFDTGLRSLVAISGTPGPVHNLGVTNLGEVETFPIAVDRTVGTAAVELIRQRFFGSIRMAKDDRADGAWIAIIHAGDRLFIPHRLLEQPVSHACHTSLLRSHQRSRAGQVPERRIRPRRSPSASRSACVHADRDRACAGGSTSASPRPVRRPESRQARAPASCGSAASA